MTKFEDPNFLQIKEEFIQKVKEIHSKSDYDDDPRRFAKGLRVAIRAGNVNLCAPYKGTSIITFDISESPLRHKFTLWHEISHHLFRCSDEGFKFLLEDKYGIDTELSRNMEEEICNSAAAVFLNPDPHLYKSISLHSLSPMAAIHLATLCGSSLQVSLRRVAEALGRDIWSIIASPTGKIEFSYTNTRFSFRKNSYIPREHVLYEVLNMDTALSVKAVMPFPNRSPRTPKREIRAIKHEAKIIALIADDFPCSNKDNNQPLLFDINPYSF